jgi:hypothetical protein
MTEYYPRTRVGAGTHSTLMVIVRYRRRDRNRGSVSETQDLCEHAKSTVHESQELLRSHTLELAAVTPEHAAQFGPKSDTIYRLIYLRSGGAYAPAIV